MVTDSNPTAAGVGATVVVVVEVDVVVGVVVVGAEEGGVEGLEVDELALALLLDSIVVSILFCPQPAITMAAPNTIKQSEQFHLKCARDVSRR